MAKKSTKTTHSMLNRLIKQNKEHLKEFCSTGLINPFKKITTLEEALIGCLKNKKMKNVLNTMTCYESSIAENRTNGEIKLEFLFSNDECCKKEIEMYKKHDNLNKKLSELLSLMKNIKDNDKN